MRLFHLQFIWENKIWNERNEEDVIIKMVEASVLKFGQMLLSLFNILFVHWFFNLTGMVFINHIQTRGSLGHLLMSLFNILFVHWFFNLTGMVFINHIQTRGSLGHLLRFSSITLGAFELIL